MPNHVTHKLIFESQHADRVFAMCPNGTLDFNLLIPQPPEVYRGCLSAEDEDDFPCNWHSWNREHWGTKWGAYDGRTAIEGDVAVVVFDTAWSVPYPILSALNNRLQVPFEHRYYDEGDNFWGIEKWGEHKHDTGRVMRISKRWSDPEDQQALQLELKGRADEEDDDE